MDIDVRQLWQSKKGLAFIITCGSVFFLAVLAIIFHADVKTATESILTAFGLHAGSQGSVDLAHKVAPIFQKVSYQPAKEAAPVEAPVEPTVTYQDTRLECEPDLTDEQKSDLADFKACYSRHVDLYEAVGKEADVPTILVAAIHWREASGDFTTYLHNGDKLGKPTTDEPKGIFFKEWKPAAIDALKRETRARKVSGITYEDTDLSSMCLYAEYYNGTGYRARNVPSPYVLSGTSCYSCGKFTSDGHYSAEEKDKELGVLVMLRALIETTDLTA